MKDKFAHKQFISNMRATKCINLWTETYGLPLKHITLHPYDELLIYNYQKILKYRHAKSSNIYYRIMQYGTWHCAVIQKVLTGFDFCVLLMSRNLWNITLWLFVYSKQYSDQTIGNEFMMREIMMNFYRYYAYLHPYIGGF